MIRKIMAYVFTGMAIFAAGVAVHEIAPEWAVMIKIWVWWIVVACTMLAGIYVWVTWLFRSDSNTAAVTTCEQQFKIKKTT